MTPLEAYAWMARYPAPRPPRYRPGHEDTQTMPSLPAWLEPGSRR